MAFDKIIYFKICSVKKNTYLCSPKTKPYRVNGVIAQLVEQRTENPCVPGSIPGDTTKRRPLAQARGLLFVVSIDTCCLRTSCGGGTAFGRPAAAGFGASRASEGSSLCGVSRHLLFTHFVRRRHGLRPAGCCRLWSFSRKRGVFSLWCL